MKRILFTALLVIICTFAASAKINVSLDDYRLAEVTADGINIRSGAGTQYPIAYSYYEDWNGKKEKMQVTQAYKSQRFWVKDAGDWWEIDTPGTIDGDSPRFISKKYCRLIESDCFDPESITEPQVWAHVEKVAYGDEEFGDAEEMSQVIIVTFYPGGLVMTQFYSPEGDNILFGGFTKDRTAIFNPINTTVAFSGDEIPAKAPLKIWADPGDMPPHLSWEYGEDTKVGFDFNGEKESYVDISGISAKEWKNMVEQLKTSKEYRSIRQYRTDPEAYMTREDFNSFRRIK